MKLSDLKEQVLSLAKVQNSQELKRSYAMARSLNLSYKKSWEALLRAFRAEDKPERASKPNMGELKAYVLKLANVQTVEQLKRNYTTFKSLDFRHYSTWAKVLSDLENNTLENSEFRNWLESPPAEHRELFQEIKDVAQALDRSIKKGNKLGAEAQKMANSMVTLSEEAQAEVNAMKQEIAQSQKIRQQADLN